MSISPCSWNRVSRTYQEGMTGVPVIHPGTGTPIRAPRYGAGSRIAAPRPPKTMPLPPDLLVHVDVLLVEALQLVLRLLPRIAVPLADETRELVELPFSHLQIVIGELPPLFLHLAAELLPLAAYDVAIHLVPLSSC